MSDFVHIHNHTHYSLQDGACTVEQLVKAAVDNDMHAVAITDHGVLYGVPEFYKEAKNKGVKPIIGMEAYITLEKPRFVKEQEEDPVTGKKRKPYRHLILLAKNLKGYKNLIKLSSRGFTEGYYYKPRIDLEVLREHSEGLICTSACLGGIISWYLVAGDLEKADKYAKEFQDIFGDDFYLELQDHNLPQDEIVLTHTPRIASKYNIKLVATNDCHYINKDDAIAHNVLLLLSDKTGDSDYRKLKYKTDQIYFKSEREMKAIFSDYPDAIANTLEIESKIDLKLDSKDYYFPNFPVPEESGAKSLDDYLVILSKQRLQEKFPDPSPEILERFNYELETIKNMGFAGYFLIVQDFINDAKSKKIYVGPGRGSAAGSLIAYILGITNINPLQYSLLFERFLNPARKSMPDIDIDFEDDRRQEVINYVKHKYGENCVSQIITFNKLSSKQVLRDVARVLKIPIPVVDKITKFIPSKFGKVFTIDQALDTKMELKWVRDSKDEKILELLKYSRVLEGFNRNMSKHAAGVVITPCDVTNYVPLATASAQGEIVTQYNMKEVEAAGLLKMDFLGLRTLSIIKDAIGLIKKNHKIEINIDEIPFDDDKTFKVFWNGQTTGIFQFESPPMREYLKQLKPTSVNDLAAMNALYRPGPMDFINDFIARKFGKKKIEYLIPELEPILKETYGIIVYQEQVIQIANQIGGMSLAEADLLRRAMGKKDENEMKRQKIKFVSGAAGKGIKENLAVELFNLIEKFANYGFNKSHSVAYAYVAYQTAYLKAHYPAEFLAANMSNELNNIDKIAKFLEDARKLKINVYPPNVNKPTVEFDVDKGKIRFGLAAIKNVGAHAIEEIIKAKAKIGRNFHDIFDFCSQVDTRLINKKVVEGLVLAGAFDSVDKNRKANFLNVERALAYGSQISAAREASKNSLFGDELNESEFVKPEIITAEDWSEAEKLTKEREVTGFYISGHPLRKYDIEYRSFSTIALGETEEVNSDLSVRASGTITEFESKYDKSNREMAFLKIDDYSGSCDCIVFSKVFEKYREFLGLEKSVMIIGKTESSGDAIKLHVDEVIPMEKVRERFTKFIKILLERDKIPQNASEVLDSLAAKHSGNYPVILELSEPGTKSTQIVLNKLRLKNTETALKELYKAFGEENIYFVPR
ncbi:MAG: DNA polymerase III subunit alpha [Ignavibacteriaceae bacterium]|nr:DNA polymerase III subunit alpha [Ignavibacteriaceae bacterium]